MMKNSFRYYIYTRKSTDSEDRQIRSIQDQIAELKELALRQGVEVVDILEEKQTAKKPGRPVFNQMLDDIETGKADGILVWHPDRLARNSVDGGRIVYMLDTGSIKDLKFVTYTFENNAQGKFMLQIAFGQSKYYIDNLSENIKRGIRHKLAQGIWPQCAPTGYLNDKTTRTIVVDPVKGPLIAKAFELYASGKYSLELLRNTMLELGFIGKSGKPLSIANWQYLFKNPFYYGIMRYRGTLYNGTHEPLISKALFDAVQERMKRRSKPTQDKTKPLKYFPYRGLFVCGECGATITPEHKVKKQKNGNVHSYTFYHCTKRVKRTCSQKYVRDEVLDAEIMKNLKRLSLPGQAYDHLLEELDRWQEESRGEYRNELSALDQQIEQNDAQQGRLMDAYLENVVSLEEYQARKSSLAETKQALKEKKKGGFREQESILVRTCAGSPHSQC